MSALCNAPTNGSKCIPGRYKTYFWLRPNISSSEILRPVKTFTPLCQHHSQHSSTVSSRLFGLCPNRQLDSWNARRYRRAYSSNGLSLLRHSVVQNMQAVTPLGTFSIALCIPRSPIYTSEAFTDYSTSRRKMARNGSELRVGLGLRTYLGPTRECFLPGTPFSSLRNNTTREQPTPLNTSVVSCIL